MPGPCSFYWSTLKLELLPHTVDYCTPLYYSILIVEMYTVVPQCIAVKRAMLNAAQAQH